MLNSINRIGEKLAKWVGDKTNFGIQSSSSRVKGFTNTFTHETLQKYLIYDAYDPNTGIFFNKRSQGFILEVAPLTGASEETVNILFSLLVDSLTPQYDLQFLLWGSDKVGHILDQFEETRKGYGEIYEWLAKKRTDFLKKGVYQSLSSQGSFLVRDFRLFIAVSRLCKPNEDHSDELIKVREDIISSLKSIHAASTNLQINDFLSVLHDWLHPSRSVYAPNEEWNPYESIATQLSNPDYLMRFKPDSIEFLSEQEKITARVLSVKKYPKKMTQWKMTDALGQLLNSALQIPCPFILSFSVRLLDKDKSSLAAQWKYMDKEKTARSPLSKFVPTIGSQFNDWEYVRQRMAEGSSLVKTLFQIVLFADENQGAASERKVRDLFNANGWSLKKSVCLQQPAFFSLLPMAMSDGAFDDMKIFGRLKTIDAFNAVNLAPMQGEWKGTKSPNLLLFGRRGQICTWNPFDNTEGNYNVAIAAASGKGKSAFVQEYLQSILGTGGRAWVIDIGRSYEKTCREFNGAFIEFSNDNKISLNPFTHIQDFDSSLTLLKPLLAAMARPTSRASDEEITYLEKAIKAAWDAEKNNATISTIAKWLETQNSDICKNLSHLLYSFTKDGMYGRYFEGKSNIDLSNKFVTLELQDLNSKKDLQRIVMMVLMYHINGVMYLGERSQPKSLILEEIWQHFDGQSEGMRYFIESLARTVRRFRGNLVSVGQSINDYFSNQTMIAVFENSDFQVILGQKLEAIDQLKKSDRLSMDAFSEHLFKSLRKTDEYSECIIKGPSGLSVLRIIFDPYSRILYSSKGEEFEAVKSLQGQGYSLREAIEMVARKFNYAN